MKEDGVFPAGAPMKSSREVWPHQALDVTCFRGHENESDPLRGNQGTEGAHLPVPDG